MDGVLPRRLDFRGLKAGFAHLINQAEPHSLPAFILWLDLKVGQFKVNGCMYPDTLHEETWVAYAREVLEKVNTNIKQQSVPDTRTSNTPSNGVPALGHVVPSMPDSDDVSRNSNHRGSTCNGGNDPLSLVTKKKMVSTSPTVSSSTNVTSSKLPTSSSHESSPVNGYSEVSVNSRPPPQSPVKKLHYGLSPIKKRPLPHDLLCNEAEISTRVNIAPNYVDSLRAESITPPPPASVSAGSVSQTPANLSNGSSSNAVGSVLGTLRSLLSEPAPPSAEANGNIPSYNGTSTIQNDNSNADPAPRHCSYTADKREPSTKETLKMVLTKKRRQRRKRTSSHPESPTLPTPPHPAEVEDIPSSGLDLTYSAPLAGTNTDVENSPSKLAAAAWSPGKEEPAPSSPKSHNVCPICYRKFDYRSSFRRHMRIHEGVYSHQCAVCGRKFTRKEHFDRHKCSRRPNKPNRSADSVSSTPTKRIKVAFPPTSTSNDGVMVGGVNRGDNQESSLHNGSSGGMLDDSLYFEKDGIDDRMSCVSNAVMTEGSVGVLARAAVLHLAESRRKSSNPRKVISQEEGVQEIEDFYQGGSPSVPDNSESDCSNSQISPPVPSRAKSPVDDPSDSEGISSPLPGDMAFADISKLVASSTDSDIPDRLREYVMMSPTHSLSEEESMSDGVPSSMNNENSSEFTLETGNYKVSEEDMMSMEGCESIETTSHGRFIKVTKQGKYLKLKNEVQVINGHLCFVCPNCSKVFHRSSNFSRHMRIHRGVYSYICPMCHRGFFRKEHFQKHKCHRKSMSHIWERKTKLDFVLKPKNSEPEEAMPSSPVECLQTESTDENGVLDTASEEDDRLYIDENPQSLV